VVVCVLRTSVLAAGLVVGVWVPPAHAQGGVGGTYPSDKAAVGAVVCTVRCVDAVTAPPGAVVRVSGRRMARVRTVIFLGGPGDADDARVRARRRAEGWVEATVPKRAASGRVRVRNGDGNPSPPSQDVLQVAPPGTPPAPAAPTAPPAPAPGAPPGPRQDHVFPVRGRHDFGGDAARFGAGRDDHVHQGHDVFAPCGTPLVAARGGRVVMKRFQDRAGNYVVIDGDGTGLSYVYMHLQAPALVERGATVTTGQPIGAVGDTGAARGCHLHFELWTAPGWQRGGAPLDPLERLRAWDAASPGG
jgi:murein DD-endopeptidase MepM/ murein hydrolase activator NlpD